METDPTEDGGEPVGSKQGLRTDAYPVKCFCGRSTIAVWELGEPEDIFHARLTIKAAGLPIVTEIVTTLTLLRTAQVLRW
jgi:hypothetical protein